MKAHPQFIKDVSFAKLYYCEKIYYSFTVKKIKWLTMSSESINSCRGLLVIGALSEISTLLGRGV